MNNNGFGNGPIRKYKKKGPSGDYIRTVAVLLMTAVIIAFVVVFVMSLTGTGMFADKKEELPPPATEEESSTPDQSEGTTDDPTVIKYKFIEKSSTDLGIGYLQLINKDNLYDFYSSELGLHVELYKISQYFEVDNSGFVIKNEAYLAFDAMAKDFYESCDGQYKLLIITAYRDFDAQKELHDKNPTGAVPPGASDYHSGATIEIRLWNTETRKVANPSGVPAARWITQNAHKYGFIFRAPTEKKAIVGYKIDWQLRYVGIPHAEYMKENNLCLEEYFEKLKNDFTYSSEHLTVKASDGNTYEIYYVAGETEGSVHLPVPENRAYTWSGDNQNGFIVTITAEKGTPPQTSTSTEGSTSDPAITD